MGIAFEGISHQLVEEQNSQHDQQEQEVGHVFGFPWNQGEDHTTAHLQGADDLTQEHRAYTNLFQSWQGLGITLVGPFLQIKIWKSWTSARTTSRQEQEVIYYNPSAYSRLDEAFAPF